MWEINIAPSNGWLEDDRFLAGASCYFTRVYSHHPQLPKIARNPSHDLWNRKFHDFMTFDKKNPQKFHAYFHSHDFTLKKFLGPHSLAKIPWLNCCRWHWGWCTNPWNWTNWYPKNIWSHFFAAGDIRIFKKTSFLVSIRPKLGGLYVPWKFNIAIGPLKNGSGWKSEDDFLLLSVLGARYSFSHNHGFLENGCIWKVTNTEGTHFSLPWIWEEG